MNNCLSVLYLLLIYLFIHRLNLCICTRECYMFVQYVSVLCSLFVCFTYLFFLFFLICFFPYCFFFHFNSFIHFFLSFFLSLFIYSFIYHSVVVICYLLSWNEYFLSGFVYLDLTS